MEKKRKAVVPRTRTGRHSGKAARRQYKQETANKRQNAAAQADVSLAAGAAALNAAFSTFKQTESTEKAAAAATAAWEAERQRSSSTVGSTTTTNSAPIQQRTTRAQQSSNQNVQTQAQNKEKKMTMSEREELGLYVCTEQQIRTYLCVAYALRFDEPDEAEWPGIARQLTIEVNCDPRTVTDVFKKCRDRDEKAVQRKEGAGRPRKLDIDNEGLIAGAIALNNGAPPEIATFICNEKKCKRAQSCEGMRQYIYGHLESVH